MTSASAGHIMITIILTPTQPVGSGRSQRESNPEPPHQEAHALLTELQRPVVVLVVVIHVIIVVVIVLSSKIKWAHSTII